MNADAKDLAAAYIRIRTERDILKRDYEAKDSELKADMDELEQLMLAFCNELNADSVKTEEGTIMRQIKERYSCSDWDSFYSFVLEHRIPQVLEKRIHQGNFKDRKSTRLNSSHSQQSRMPSSA